MVEREPKLFRNWNNYMKLRQIMASALIFNNHGWFHWEIGHAKLFGILLWEYETKKKKKFKYSITFKKLGYRRTHNYRLLKGVIENNLLQRDGDGFYSFTLRELMMLKKIMMVLKGMDMISKEKIIIGGRKNR
jgi:hypothetical protein